MALCLSIMGEVFALEPEGCCNLPCSGARSLISILEAKLPSLWNGSEKRKSVSLSVEQTYGSASAVLIPSHHLHRGRVVHTRGVRSSSCISSGGHGSVY